MNNELRWTGGFSRKKCKMKFGEGFILVTTIWILAIITVAAGFFALWTQRSLSIAQSMQEDIQGEIDLYSTQADVLYLLATQRFTIGGLTVPLPKKEEESASLTEAIMKKALTDYSSDPAKGTEIVQDDRPYFGHGKAYFAMQDAGGLINLNFESDEVISRLLGTLGVKVELRDSLVAKLRDYTDVDDLKHLNGAESYEYRQFHLPPPSNRLLSNPLECKRILGWSDQPGLWEEDALAQLTNTLLPAHPNFNTAPAKVLQAAYNMDTNGAERIIKLRQSMLFYDLDTVSQVAGVNINLEPIDANFFPGSVLRLTLWYEGGRRMRQIHLLMNPRGFGMKPWLIDYSLELKLLSIYTKTLPNHAKTSIFVSSLPAKTP
jgi:hypothetical protein